MFKNLVGNDNIKKDLNKILESRNISHSYMFIGTAGIGKKEFAKAILCENTNDICETCKSCIEFQNNNNPDFYYIGLEENSIKIDTIRKMQQKVQELPIVSNKKVYIIDDSEYMTKEAQNCLLKTLEEPPEFVTIILITSNENLILNTVKSRCTKIYFKNIPDKIIKEYLKNNYNISISDNLIKASNGSIERAIKLQEQQEIYTTLEKIFSNVERYKILDVINDLEILYKSKENIFELLDYINVLFFNNVKNNKKYIDYIEYIEQTKKNLKQNCNYDMSIDNLIFKIWEE